MIGQNFVFPFLGLFCLIAINAFFTAAEFSIVSVRRSRISQLAKSGDIQAQTVQSFQRAIERLLSTTQLGITLSSLALGWIGEPTIAVVTAQLIRGLPFSESVTEILSHSFAVPIAFIGLVYLQIVLGELVPKSLALLYPEQLARFFAPPSLVISGIFRPFLAVLNISTRCLLNIGKTRYTEQLWQEQLTAKELQLIITTEKEYTGLEAKQRKLLQNVLEFGEVTAAQIMIPRTQIKYLAEEATFAELLEKIATEQFFRYPIIGDSLDDIKGVIDYKSLAIPLAKQKLNLETIINPWIQPVSAVSESIPLKKLLSLMQKEKQSMVIVIDQFGGTSGLITIQDLITEIIGNQDHLTASETKLFKKIAKNSFIVSAQMNIEDINQRLETNLPLTDEYHTLSGFLQEQWQKIPNKGEILQYNDLQFTVVATENNCLQQIKIETKQNHQSQELNNNQIAVRDLSTTDFSDRNGQ